MWLEAGLGTPSERNDSACMMLTKDVWQEALVLLQVTAPAIGKQGSVERAFIRLCRKWTWTLYRPSRSLEQFRTQGLESTAVQSGVLARALNLHRDKKKRWRERGRDGKFLSNTGFYA